MSDVEQPQKRIRVIVEGPIQSPFADLLESIPASVLNIAPERREEARAYLQTVTLRVDAAPYWSAFYEPSEARITISWRCIEVLWSVAYAMTLLVDEVMPGAKPGVAVSLQDHPEVARAMKLLRWSLDDWFNKRGQPFPSDLLPERYPRQLGSRAAVADELCLCAVAFVLHHELAHHRLKHHHTSGAGAEANADAVDAERDADAEAINWMLSATDPTTLFFVKRAAGVVILLTAIVARGIHTGDFGGHSHPRSFDRLISWVDNFTQDDSHTVWVLIAAALKLQLDNSELVRAPEGEFESYRECANAYIDVLAAKWREMEALSKGQSDP